MHEAINDVRLKKYFSGKSLGLDFCPSVKLFINIDQTLRNIFKMAEWMNLI